MFSDKYPYGQPILPTSINQSWQWCWTTILIYYIGTRLCHFCSYNAVEYEANFMLERPLYKFMEDKFPSVLHNVVLRNLKFLSIGLPKFIFASTSRRLLHYATLASLKPSWCTSIPWTFSTTTWTLKSISFHFISLSKPRLWSQQYGPHFTRARHQVTLTKV